MKVKQSILDVINNPSARTRIAFDIKTGENNVAIIIRKNSEDGPMTKMRFLKAVEKETGVPIAELLEEEVADAAKVISR